MNTPELLHVSVCVCVCVCVSVGLGFIVGRKKTFSVSSDKKKQDKLVLCYGNFLSYSIL